MDNRLVWGVGLAVAFGLSLIQDPQRRDQLKLAFLALILTALVAH